MPPRGNRKSEVYPLTEKEFHHDMITRLGRPAQVRLNRNVRNIVSGSQRDGALRVSIHRMFLSAPESVRDALAEFLLRPNERNRRIVRRFIDENAPREIASPDRYMVSVDSGEGDHYDLGPIARRLNRQYFANALDFQIVWGRRTRNRRRTQHHVTLGVCHSNRRLIRIHPILDTPRVPQFYLEYVIYHEMLHLAIPSRTGKDGRMIHHGRTFSRREREYVFYEHAIEWQNRNLNRLLSWWGRSGKRNDQNRTQGTLFA